MELKIDFKALWPKAVSWLKIVPGAVILAAAIFFSTTLLGGWILKLQREYRLDIFNEALNRRGLVVKMLSDEDVAAVTNKYIGAVADATINFELFPQKLEFEMFFGIVSTMPNKLSIDKFEFNGSSLYVYCHAPSEAVFEDFCGALNKLEPFKQVEYKAELGNSGLFNAVITVKYH